MNYKGTVHRYEETLILMSSSLRDISTPPTLLNSQSIAWKIWTRPLSKR